MPERRAAQWVVGLLGLILLCGAEPFTAAAQRPFHMHDPFYRGETARRAFFDGYALAGEVAYRPTGVPVNQEGAPAAGVDPLGLSFRFDYQLASQLDLGAILAATGGRSGRTLSVSWVVLKYYDYSEGTDFAFRLAVDPASDGLVGFPQMDVALITTSLLSPDITNDLAVGMRRVRMGYERWVRTGSDPSSDALNASSTEAADAPSSSLEVMHTRVMGWELHLMASYKYHFDPAGSHIFISMRAEGGEYDLFETSPPEGEDGAERASDRALTTRYQSGVVWVRSGFEYSRPSYQVNPFVGIPLVQWISEDEEGLHSRLSAGLRLTLR